MKALSLVQPWLDGAILAHIPNPKRIENRVKWTGCSYQGTILLHASKSVGSRNDFNDTVEAILDIVYPDGGAERRYALAKPFAEIRTDLRGRKGEALWTPKPSLKLGGIVGRARIDGIIKNEADFAAYAANVSGGEAQRVWWQGGFALVLADVEPLPFVPWVGALGLFEVDESRLKKLGLEP